MSLRIAVLIFCLFSVVGLVAPAQNPAPPAVVSADTIPAGQLIQPTELVKLLNSKTDAPLVIQVGSQVFYQEARIPGAKYAGPGSRPAGLQALEKIAAAGPKDKFIVLYCGCCPWGHCPNVAPAFQHLHELGYTNVKVLYLANNFGDDWVRKGYPREH